MMVNGYWSIWIGRCDPLDFLLIHWNLGDLGPCFPWGSIISGSWTFCHLTLTVCHLTLDIFHFFYYAERCHALSLHSAI